MAKVELITNEERLKTRLVIMRMMGHRLGKSGAEQRPYCIRCGYYMDRVSTSPYLQDTNGSWLECIGVGGP